MTREMIKRGFENGTISIENEFCGCVSLCCRIGDNAFYFAGCEDENLTVEEYLAEYSLEEIVDKIYDVLKDEESAEEYGLDDNELEYYELILN
jgi:hypothetical protein